MNEVHNKRIEGQDFTTNFELCWNLNYLHVEFFFQTRQLFDREMSINGVKKKVCILCYGPHCAFNTHPFLFSKFKHFDCPTMIIVQNGVLVSVTTLTLGWRPRQGLVKVQAKCEGRESHSMLSGVQENVREWTPTLPSELPLWELDSRWTFESLENDFRGQNPLDWRVPYVIGNLLELKCLKWACMTHLDT